VFIARYALNSHTYYRYVRHLDTNLSTLRHGCDPRTVHVRFMINKVALDNIFLRVLRFSQVIIIPPMFHTHHHHHHLLLLRLLLLLLLLTLQLWVGLGLFKNSIPLLSILDLRLPTNNFHPL
jgi:hypothetical protein